MARDNIRKLPEMKTKSGRVDSLAFDAEHRETGELGSSPSPRALRRHHYQRLKRRRRYHWGHDVSDDPRAWGVATNTPQTCSCAMCGNPRRCGWMKKEKRTIQERRELSSR